MSVVLKIEFIKDARLGGPQFSTPGPVARHLDEAGYHVTCGLGSDFLEAARAAAAHMIELLVRLHHIAPVDAYLLCSVCGDLAISGLVNRQTHVVSLHFPRLIFE
jgi:acetamidase/formamidase